jgi:hypothetical protein
MNNLYVVASERLLEKVVICDDGSGPMEPYSIVVMVVAKSRAQAAWKAWETDPVSFSGCVSEKPRMSVYLLEKNVPYPRGTVVSDWQRYDHYWKDKRTMACFNAARKLDEG